MKITSFTWHGKSFDMALLNAFPETMDQTGYSVFGFDALQLLNAIGVTMPTIDTRHPAVLMGNSMPMAYMRVIFESFTHEDIFTEADAPMDRIFVSYDGFCKLGDLLSFGFHFQWLELIENVSCTMRLYCTYLRSSIDDRSFSVTEEDHTGSTSSRIIAPKIPIRT
jgi:hypothetical protein